MTRLRRVHDLMILMMAFAFLAANVCCGIVFMRDATDVTLEEELDVAQQIELEKVFIGKRLKNGEGWTQGFTVTNKYFVVVSTINEGENVITAYDKNSFEIVREVRTDIGHGNDLTYNAVANEIVSLGAPNNTIKIFDADTLKELPERKLELGEEKFPSVRANSIAYDSDLDRYYMLSPKHGGKVYNGDFTPTDFSFDTSSAFNLYQTTSYHNGHLFFSRACHVDGSECARVANNEVKEASPDRDEKYAPSSSALFVYDAKSGEREEILYIPPNDEEGRYFGELEGASVDENNEIYLIFSSYMNNLPTVGDAGTFVIYKLKKDSKMEGNKTLRKMLYVKKKSPLEINTSPFSVRK